MIRFVLHVLATALGFWVASKLMPHGVAVDGLGSLLAAGLLLGVVNALVRPILVILTFPLTLLTLGLFLLVVNGLMLWLTSSLSSALGLGFHVNGFWSAFFGALVVSIVSTILSMVIVADSSSEARGYSR